MAKFCIKSDFQNPDWLDIECIYPFNWEKFTDADWATLNTIYTQLLGYKSITEDSEDLLPRWFSRIDNPEQGFLWASVEPPGLQVVGTLPKDTWQAWDKQFRAEISILPFHT